MPTNQLDVFLVAYTGNSFIRWADKLDISLHDEANPSGQFLYTPKEERVAFRREPAVVLYLLDPQSLRASIAFYASFTPKTIGVNNGRTLCLEGLVDIESMRNWGKGMGSMDIKNFDFIDCLRRAYKYLHADLGFMDYKVTEEDKHRIIIPDGSYTKLQQLGRPVPDIPFAVSGFEETGLKLVPSNLDFAKRFLKPTAEYHQG